jgi:hypothetical protein
MIRIDIVVLVAVLFMIASIVLDISHRINRIETAVKEIQRQLLVE